MSPENFNPSKPLAEATVQELQLELIRRTRFNAFDGEQILKSLLKHRHLWEAVILDQLGLPRVPGKLPPMGLIKLRDLEDNYWNADKLYILTPNKAAARQLAAIVESEDWGGEVPQVHTDREEVDAALGTGRTEQVVVTIWWD